VSAIDSIGQLWGWAYNPYGNVGDGWGAGGSACQQLCTDDGTSKSNGVCSNTPLVVLQNAVQATRTSDAAMAIDASGQLYGWGSPADGEIGITANSEAACVMNLITGSNPLSPAPGGTCTFTQNEYWSGLPAMMALSGGFLSTFAEDQYGEVWVTGDNQYGGLGLAAFPSSPYYTYTPTYQSSLTPGSTTPSSMSSAGGSSSSGGPNTGGYWQTTSNESTSDSYTLKWSTPVYLTGVVLYDNFTGDFPANYWVSVSPSASGCGGAYTVATSSTRGGTPGDVMSITFPAQPVGCLIVGLSASASHKWDIAYIWGIE